jgi:hypothetical protein
MVDECPNTLSLRPEAQPESSTLAAFPPTSIQCEWAIFGNCFLVQPPENAARQGGDRDCGEPEPWKSKADQNFCSSVFSEMRTPPKRVYTAAPPVFRAGKRRSIFQLDSHGRSSKKDCCRQSTLPTLPNAWGRMRHPGNDAPSDVPILKSVQASDKVGV